MTGREITSKTNELQRGSGLASKVGLVTWYSEFLNENANGQLMALATRQELKIQPHRFLFMLNTLNSTRPDFLIL